MRKIKFLTERGLLAAFYGLWLCVAVWFFFHYEYSDFFWFHLFYIGLVPLAGLWFLYWKRDIGYVCAGILMFYLVQQVLYGRYVIEHYQYLERLS